MTRPRQRSTRRDPSSRAAAHEAVERLAAHVHARAQVAEQPHRAWSRGNTPHREGAPLHRPASAPPPWKDLAEHEFSWRYTETFPE